MRCYLFGPLHRRIHRVRPTDRIMVVGARAAQLVDHREQKRNALLDAIGGGADFVCRALQRSLGAGAIISHHENDQSIIQLARLLDSVEQSTDIVVGV